jgi:hypothetical protein
MNEIDNLWDKWIKDHDDNDVDRIIAYFRKQLAMYDAGVKPKRVEAEQVDMAKILENIKQRGTTRQAASKPKPISKGWRRI